MRSARHLVGLLAITLLFGEGASAQSADEVIVETGEMMGKEKIMKLTL